MKHTPSKAARCSVLALTAILLTPAMPALAHENGAPSLHALDHAPIGVMGDHRHKKGEWMLSYRFMHMDMDGNRDGKNSLSPTEIATTIPNRFSGQAMQPPTLRVVPTKMPMNMHMIGGMYGLSDRITLMAMTNILDIEMDHITFRGGMGSTVRGEFTTHTSGIGDSRVAAIIGIDDGTNPNRQINFNVGLSLPTGSNEKTDQILTPMGGTPSPRLPYPMQLGTGTCDFTPALTYFEKSSKIGWGAQMSARLPLGKNAEDYKYGNRLEATAWLSYEPEYWLSFSSRIKGVSQGTLKGLDPTIVAPVQTADPDNHGGEHIQALFGINLVGQSGTLKGHRLGIEYGLPLHRHLNGPQLETDSVITLGWQKAF